jgi:hypothetical protein
MKKQIMIKCVACKKSFPEKEKTMIWCAPYCRDCTNRRAENFLKAEKEEKARRKKRFEERVRKIVNRVLKEKRNRKDRVKAKGKK